MGLGGAKNPILDFQLAVNQMFGMRQYQEGAEEGGRIREQANLAVAEAEREAVRKQRDVHLFREGQAHAYAAGGVMLDGSPLAVIEETRRLGDQEVAAIRESGRAKQRLLIAEAEKVERGGLQSLLSVSAENKVTKMQDAERRRAERYKLIGGIVRSAASIGSSLMGGF